jgi:hypothetical protein
MKIDKLLILFLIIGCILVAGYFTRSLSHSGAEKNLSDSLEELNSTTENSTNESEISPIQISTVSGSGQVTISIGQFDAQLPVFIDTVMAGNVSKAKPLNLFLAEGTHTIGICQGSVCESLPVEILPRMKTTIDFEERLRKDAPPGSLNISIGSYPASLPVFIDSVKSGNVSPGHMINQTLNIGNHTVKVCLGTTCFDETVGITPAAQVMLDFGERLQNGSPQGSLSVSIGGFDAELPVLIDTINVGNVSKSHPLNLRLNVGNHSVRVCMGKVCEQEEVSVIFARPSIVDFGGRLEKDVEFTVPTARITRFSMSGTAMTVDVEFINPDTVDHTIYATVSDIYSYTNSQNVRVSDSEQADVLSAVKAGARLTKQVVMYLTGGQNTIGNEPVITDIAVE